MEKVEHNFLDVSVSSFRVISRIAEPDEDDPAPDPAGKKNWFGPSGITISDPPDLFYSPNQRFHYNENSLL